MFKNYLSKQINISAENLVQTLLKISENETVCLLDSCGVGHLNSRYLIAGIKPLETYQITNKNAYKSLAFFDEILSTNFASVFTISYDFGLKLENIAPQKKERSSFIEPDIFLATFDSLIIYNYNSQITQIIGNEEKFVEISETLKSANYDYSNNSTFTYKSTVSSNFTKDEYINKIKEIQEYIRQGETYQTNLTQQFRAELPQNLIPQQIFFNLRTNHPAPFSSFIKRKNDYVVSISPERFVQVETNPNKESKKITTSPIKGTRPRGKSVEEDLRLKKELINSKKDLAENTMIVDLLRNDIGRICEFGSVNVEKLCELEEHPSLFHLVSTVSGTLRQQTNYADIIKATFPCGSITGCPKIRTMQIIETLETKERGLSMGAIGYAISNQFNNEIFNVQIPNFQTSVAIRTMVIRQQEAIFNVGGGIVIDSNPEDEYDESLLKAKALFEAIGTNIS